ncbi:MAG: DUF1510 family protein [Anaerobacillus sp.]|uniref:DUF1510 family protein n=1 Tax=Anaerobacillus sp. TaxID=1872506 RepID=UPI00391B2321
MREEDYYGSSARRYKQKRKKVDKILNISIGVVIFLILLVGGQFLLGGKSSEKAVGDQIEEQVDSVIEDGEVEEPSNEEASNDAVESTEEEANPANESETAEAGEGESSSQSGAWKPIGTVQQEPFAAVYQKDHVNWEEMTRAFQVATGLGDNIILWRVGNGGDHLSAVGYVSDAATRTTPYKVRIEWVTNEGWMPVSVEQLNENPYDTPPQSSTTNSEDGESDDN